MLEIAFQNAPEMESVVDKAVKVYNVGIIRYSAFTLGSLFSSHMYVFLRLPVKHCSVNPIELAWRAMERYIRDHNTKFRLSDVERLAFEWVAAVDPDTAQRYFSHAQEHKLVERKADAYAELIEEDLADDNNESQLSGDETANEVDAWYYPFMKGRGRITSQIGPLPNFNEKVVKPR